MSGQRLGSARTGRTRVCAQRREKMPEIRARVFEGEKFMWDGKEYATMQEAQKAEIVYQQEGFEIMVVEDQGKFHIYTRKVIKEVIVQGQA